MRLLPAHTEQNEDIQPCFSVVKPKHVIENICCVMAFAGLLFML